MSTNTIRCIEAIKRDILYNGIKIVVRNFCGDRDFLPMICACENGFMSFVWTLERIKFYVYSFIFNLIKSKRVNLYNLDLEFFTDGDIGKKL